MREWRDAIADGLAELGVWLVIAAAIGFVALVAVLEWLAVMTVWR
jgi:hypothetical protein